MRSVFSMCAAENVERERERETKAREKEPPASLQRLSIEQDLAIPIAKKKKKTC